MMANTKACTPEIQAGRLSKANQFLRAADLIAESIDDDELADAYITLCVHAGVAAADVICCAKQQEHSISPNHKNAVVFLAIVDHPNSVHLNTLIDMKTHAGYTEIASTPELCKSAGVAAAALVQAARLV